MAWIATTTAYREGSLATSPAEPFTGPAPVDAGHDRSSTGPVYDPVAGRLLGLGRLSGIKPPGLHADCVAAGLGPDDGVPYVNRAFTFNLACSPELLRRSSALVR